MSDRLIDPKEYAAVMRKEAVRNENGIIQVAPELWEQIASLIERAIMPPCKVGDEIYMVVTRKTHSFKCEKGKRMVRLDNQHTFIKQTYLTRLNFFKVLDDFGKTVFLNREDAERALEELPEFENPAEGGAE